MSKGCGDAAATHNILSRRLVLQPTIEEQEKGGQARTVCLVFVGCISSLPGKRALRANQRLAAEDCHDAAVDQRKCCSVET